MLQQERDDLDTLALERDQPRLVLSLGKIFHALELVVAPGIVLVGRSDAVDDELQAPGLEHAHHHGRAGPREA